MKYEYEYLYICKPDPYRHHVGDLDFHLEPKGYEELKHSFLNGKQVEGTCVFERPDLDMIEPHTSEVDVLAYVCTKVMSEAVRQNYPMLLNCNAKHSTRTTYH